MAFEIAAEIKSALADIVGAKAVSDKPALLQEHSQAMAPVPEGKAIAIVRPKTPGEVQAVVNLANRTGINLVPVSSSPPRFRGDSVPLGEGVIVDLSGIDSIMRMDSLNKVAIIEPGVSFSEFKQEAEKQGLRVFMPLLPRAGKSALASYLEREPITVPKYHWDMSDPMLCTEIVLGTGDIFRTGSAAGPGSLQEQWKMGSAQKNPEGPAQTALSRVVQGAQGTMGIVTWASIKLGMLPRLHKPYFVQEGSLEKLIDFSYRVLRLKFADEFVILNDFALASILCEEPTEIESFAAMQAPFTIFYCVAGYENFPEKRVSYQFNGIADIAQYHGVKIMPEIPGISSRKAMNVLNNPAKEPYWKLRYKGGFREIFFLTTMDRTAHFKDIITGFAKKYGYPPQEIGIYIQPVQQGRTCHMEFNLFFDPSDQKEVKMIESIFSESIPVIADAGAFFSRPYGPVAKVVYDRCPDTVKALKMVKEILDPQGVLNRGKLCFGDGEVGA